MTNLSRFSILFLWVAHGCVSGFSFNEVSGNKNSRRMFLTESVERIIGGTTTAFLVPDIANAASAPPKNAPMIGKKAPDFNLMNSKGDFINLATLTKTGKWTVLYFYPGAFTSGCTLEARGFQRDIEKYRSLNTQIVGVSVDSVEKNAQFCSAEGLDFFMLSDVGGVVSKDYGSSLSIPGFGTFSNRQTYIIDPNGNTEYVFTDVESRVSRHSQEVLEKLAQLTKSA